MILTVKGQVAKTPATKAVEGEVFTEAEGNAIFLKIKNGSNENWLVKYEGGVLQIASGLSPWTKELGVQMATNGGTQVKVMGPSGNELK